MTKMRLILAGCVCLFGALIAAQAPGQKAKPDYKIADPQFQTSDRCVSCHNGITTSTGEDISFGFHWRPSMMANSARDPYWLAGVRREIMDHPSARAAIEDECSVCHMPMASREAKLAGHEGEVFAHFPFNPGNTMSRLAADGVSCSVCHRIENKKLGARESFVGGFVIDPALRAGQRPAYGPFPVDAGRVTVMRSSSGFRPTEGKHIRQSELCATCHTLYTKALGPRGQAIGELPEQVPYQEWLHSEYRDKKSCQSCHMPAVDEEAPITSTLGQPHPGVARHTFIGGNFFMMRLLSRFGKELGVEALPQELENAATRTVSHLQTDSARVSIENVAADAGRLSAELLVENLAGHKLPTAYPSRRAWLQFLVRDRDGKVVFESGAWRRDGSIEGNDNDADGQRYEPHYAEIRTGDQVQVYEAVMGDASGNPTTGLLSGVRYLKDNRLLPRGFDKGTADNDVAVYGAAAGDADFTGGRDRVRYSVSLSGAQGPFRIEAVLWYQSIGFRWAANLRAYDAEEPRRFTRYYDSAASASAVALARASATR